MPNCLVVVGQVCKSIFDLLGVLSDCIGASFDHFSLLLFIYHFEVFDDPSQFGDQGHRADDVIMGRFLFLEDEA